MTVQLRRVEGVRLALRLVEASDAGFIHDLRTDPALNAHLSPVTGTVTEQRAWIADYKRREATGAEYYFVVERLVDGLPCGLVRLYNISEVSFTWGSWILASNKPPKAALESAVLSFGVGFEELDRERAMIDVRRKNTHAIAFYRRFGAREIGADDVNLYFDYTRARFEADRPRYLEILSKQREP